MYSSNISKNLFNKFICRKTV